MFLIPKLFGKWDFSEVEVKDPGLKRYICLRPLFYPYSAGRHERRAFGKGEVMVVERLANMLMRPGKNGGKKAHAISIVRHAFEIIHVRTGKNPIQVLVDAIHNSSPKEETTRVAYGGIVYCVSMDLTSPVLFNGMKTKTSPTFRIPVSTRPTGTVPTP